MFFKTVYPCAVSEDLSEPRSNSWRETLYSITNPHNIKGKEWLYRTGKRCKDKKDSTFRYNAMGVHEIRKDRMFANNEGFSKPQSFTFADPQANLLPPPFGRYVIKNGIRWGTKLRHSLLSGLRIPCDIGKEDKEAGLAQEYAKVHSISTYDQSTYDRGYYARSRHVANLNYSLRKEEGFFFNCIPSFKKHLLKVQASSEEKRLDDHNECLIRAKWKMDGRCSLVVFEEAGIRSLRARFLTLIRQSDMRRRLKALCQENNKKYPEGYEIPISIYSSSSQPYYYYKKRQQYDYHHAIEKKRKDPVCERLLNFLDLDRKDYKNLSYDTINYIKKNLRWMSGIASSLSYESSQLFFDEIIKKNWQEIITYEFSNQIYYRSDPYQTYVNIFKCTHPENLSLSCLKEIRQSITNVDYIGPNNQFGLYLSYIYRAFFYVLNNSGYTMPVSDFITMVERISLRYGHQLKPYQRALNQYLLIAIDKKQYEEANTLLELGAKADFAKEEPNKTLALGLAIKRQKYNLAVKIIEKEIGRKEGSEARYLLLKEKKTDKCLANQLALNFQESRNQALYFAIKKNDTQAALKFLNNGALVCAHKKDTLRLIIESNNEELFNAILKKGNVPNKELARAVYWSSVYNMETSFLASILEKNNKVDINTNDISPYKWSPLHYSVKYKNHLAIAALCDAGADITLKNSYHETAVDVAIEIGDILSMKMILSNISSNCQKFKYELYKLCVKLTSLKRRLSFHPDVKSEITKLLLGLAVENNNLSMVKTFIKLGTPASGAALEWESYLEHAIENGKIKLIEILIHHKPTLLFTKLPSYNKTAFSLLLSLPADKIKESIENLLPHLDVQELRIFLKDEVRSKNIRWKSINIIFNEIKNKSPKLFLELTNDKKFPLIYYGLLHRLTKDYKNNQLIKDGLSCFFPVGKQSPLPTYLEKKLIKMAVQLGFKYGNYRLSRCIANHLNEKYAKNLFIDELTQYLSSKQYSEKAKGSILRQAITNFDSKTVSILMSIGNTNIFQGKLVNDLNDNKPNDNLLPLIILASLHTPAQEERKNAQIETLKTLLSKVNYNQLYCFLKQNLPNIIYAPYHYDRPRQKPFLPIIKALKSAKPKLFNQLINNKKFLTEYLKALEICDEFPRPFWVLSRDFVEIDIISDERSAFNEIFSSAKQPNQLLDEEKKRIYFCLKQLMLDVLSDNANFGWLKRIVERLPISEKDKHNVDCIVYVASKLKAIGKIRPGKAGVNKAIEAANKAAIQIAKNLGPDTQQLTNHYSKELKALKTSSNKHRGHKRKIILFAALTIAVVVGTILSGGILAIPILAGIAAKLTIAGTAAVATSSTLAAECGLFSVYNRVKNKKWTINPMTNTQAKICQTEYEFNQLRTAPAA